MNGIIYLTKNTLNTLHLCFNGIRALFFCCCICREISNICNAQSFASLATCKIMRVHKCGGSVEELCRQRFLAIWNKSLVICSQGKALGKKEQT
jgi:hypothetical protein